jgi:hypothetical protein
VSAARRLLRWTIAIAVAFGLITYVALEGNEVGVLHTHTDNNAWRDTHVWLAEDDTGALWVEAATPDRPWLLELQRNHEVELDRGGATQRLRAVVVDDPTARDLVRSLLSEKYGWADWWVGLLQDRSTSVPDRLAPPPTW